MTRNVGLLVAAGILCATLMTGAGDLGIFTNEDSVGQTPPGCQARYDPAKSEYRSVRWSMWG